MYQYYFGNKARTVAGIVLLLCAGLLWSAEIRAQDPPKTEERKTIEEKLNGIYASIIMLVPEGRYAEAEELIVKNIIAYPQERSFQAALYMTMSDIQRLTGNREKAFTCLDRSEALLHDIGEDFWNSAKNVIYQRKANLFFESGQNDSACTYAQMSMAAAKQYQPSHDIDMQRLNLPIIAHRHMLRKEYALAEKILRETAKLNTSQDAEAENANIYVKLSEVLLKQGQTKEAIVFAEKAFALAEMHEESHYKLLAAKNLIDLYRQVGNYEKLAKYLQLKMDITEESQLYEQQERLQELQTQFDTRLKEEENLTLKAINHEQEVQSRWQWVVISLSVLMLAVMTAFAWSYRKQRGRIARQKEDVERVNMLNQKIFSVISHDFKGPMLGIDLLLGMHEKYGMDAETFAKQTALLRSDLSQANLVMENLLDWSKTELGFTDSRKNTSDVAAVFSEVKAQLRLSIEQKKLTVHHTVPAENRLSISPDILKIVLRNLLSNAVKYSYEEGRIEFMYEAGNNRYVLHDGGLGMEKQQLDRLFVGRVGSRLGTRHESGYGIGLHLVHELVLKNGGRIWAESKPGQGTSVYFTFAA